MNPETNNLHALNHENIMLLSKLTNNTDAVNDISIRQKS